MGQDLTEDVRQIVTANPNMLVPHYLIHSYLYYVLDQAVISDCFYEEICRQLDSHWDTIQHTHKPLVDRASLRAGTGYYLKEGDYPGLVKGSACWMVDHLNKQTRKGKRNRKQVNPA